MITKLSLYAYAPRSSKIEWLVARGSYFVFSYCRRKYYCRPMPWCLPRRFPRRRSVAGCGVWRVLCSCEYPNPGRRRPRGAKQDDERNDPVVSRNRTGACINVATFLVCGNHPYTGEKLMLTYMPKSITFSELAASNYCV